jgi:hypothetical protein
VTGVTGDFGFKALASELASFLGTHFSKFLILALEMTYLPAHVHLFEV